MSITPFDRQAKAFQDRLTLLKKHQSLPTLLGTLSAGIESPSSDLKQVSAILSEIFTCDDDQFWLKDNSAYYREFRDELDTEWISRHRRPEHDFNGLLDAFWKVFRMIQFDDVGERSLLSNSDFQISNNERPEDNPLPDEDLQSEFTESVREIMTSFVGYIFPLPLFIDSSDFLSSYGSELDNLSSYLSKYFCSYPNRTWNKENKLSISNKIEIIKIFSAILFSRIEQFRPLSGTGFSLDGLLQERRDTHDFASLPASDAAKYTIAVSNILMAGALLDVGTVENNILNKDEVSLNFLASFCGEHFIRHVRILTLPNELIQCVFLYITDPDYFYSCDVLLSHASIGRKRFFERDDFISLLQENFELTAGHNDSDKQFINNLVEEIADIHSNWIIPLQEIHNVQYVTHGEFFHSRKNIEAVSSALREADKDGNFDSCLLSEDWVGDHVLSQIDLKKSDHLALHAISTAFNVEEAGKFINLAHSLLSNRQPYFACLVISSLLQVRIPEDDIEWEELSANELAQILEHLVSLPCFDLVQQSIIEYLQSGRCDQEYSGLLKAYLSDKQLAQASITPAKRKPPGKSLQVPRNLCPNAQIEFDRTKDFLDSYHDNKESLTDFDNQRMRSDIIKYFHMGLEAELRERVKNLDQDSIDDLRETTTKLKDFDPNRKHINLFDLLLIIDNFQKCLPGTQNRMPLIENLSKHKKAKTFLDDCHFIRKLRNEIVHSGDNRTQQEISEQPDELDEAILKIRKGEGILKILGETGKPPNDDKPEPLRA